MKKKSKVNDKMEKYKKWFKQHSIITLIIFNFFIFTFLFLSFELFLKYRNQKQNWCGNVKISNMSIKLLSYEPLTDTKVYPTDKYIKYVDAKNLKQNMFTFRTDSNGCIMPSLNYEKPDFRIAFLGGSTTECFFVHEKNRFPNLSCRILEDKTGKKINSYNYGFSGTNSMHSINTLLNRVLPTNPDFVFLMHNINDLSTLFYTNSYWNSSNRSLLEKNKKITIGLKVRRIIRKIFPNTYLLVKNIFLKRNNDEWANYRDKNFIANDEVILSQFINSLLTFIYICNIWDIQPVIMTQPNRFPDTLSDTLSFSPLYKISNNTKYIELYNNMNNAIREVAKKQDVLIVDLEKSIPKDTLFIYDMVHLNDSGSILASKIIANKMEQYILEFSKNSSLTN